MSDEGLRHARDVMRADGADDDAIEVFAHYYRELESGASGLIPESSIEPVRDLDRLDELHVDEAAARDAFAKTVVIKLNGGLGTSMGMTEPKSLLTVKNGLSFLDIIARQITSLRSRYDAPLPVVFMNSFSTQPGTEAALAPYDELPTPGIPMYFQQNREPKLLVDTLEPASWPADPDLAWCPPGHGDLYPALRSTGMLARLLDAGFRYAFCSNSDNLGAVADPRIAGHLVERGAPFLLESCRRTPADRKGGHLAVRRSDGRLVLRETAQTSTEDQAAMQDLGRHQYCNSNNVWIDLQQLADELDARGGVLDLPLIRNVKTVDPADASSPRVVQIESAMGAAVQCFDNATSLEVSRDRFVPVKTTNDLLVLRSDVYALDDNGILVRSPQRRAAADPFVDLDPVHYRLISQFDQRFPAGAPSMVAADRLIVRGGVTFGPDVVIRGDVRLDGEHTPTVSETVLSG